MAQPKPLTPEMESPDGERPAGALNSDQVDPHRPLEDQFPDGDGETHTDTPLPDALEQQLASETPPADAPKKKGPGRPPKPEPEAREVRVADSVGPIAKLLIADHFPHLEDTVIHYVFVSVASTTDGKPVITKSHKVSGLHAWLANGSEDGEANPFFVVEISETHWSNMSKLKREAFLDDALSNLGKSNKGALKILRRDI